MNSVDQHDNDVAVVHSLTLSLERDGTRSDILRGIDLRVKKGEIVGLVGESGSGKSVLALALLGLLPESSKPKIRGGIRVAGVDILTAKPEALRAVRRDQLGVIFQDPMTSLNPTMRVGRQITEVTRDKTQALRLMTQVGIAEPELRFHVYPHELSGGLRQRVMTAIALTGSPSLIIADEPTTALDVTVQAQVLDLLLELRDTFNCSVVFITHDLAVAAQVADRIAVLYAGRICEIGPTAEILHNPTHPYTAGLLRSRLSLRTPRNELLRTLRPETASAEERMKGCAYHSRCPLAIERCAAEQPPLFGAGAEGALESASAGEHLRACWRGIDEVRALGKENLSLSPVTNPAIAISHTQPAVVVTDVHARFVLKSGGRKRREVHALRGVTLTVEPGEAISIVGESGSGKSTLLRVIAGLTPASAGSVQVAQGGAQMVFQDAGSSLTPWLTVGELLRERLIPLKLSTSDSQKRVDGALDSIGLPAAVRAFRPSELSGGQRQRVALARATMIPPAVLLCDEPTSALDASLAASVLNLIREMRQQLVMTVLFITHDLSVARLMGDRIVVMTNGEIVEVGASDDVILRPNHSYTQKLLASVPQIGVTA